MTTTYNPTTFGKLLSWIAKENVTGLNLEDDREELEEIGNLIREFWYNQYHNISLFDNYITCHKVECYPLECNDPCDCSDNNYWGITAPADLAAIEEAWYNKKPLYTRSRWWEGKEGIIAQGYGDMQIVPMDQETPLRHPLKSCSALTIQTQSRCDDGKEFVIEGTILASRGGEEEIEDYEITDTLIGGKKIDTPVQFMSVTNIIMPDDLEGYVRILDEDGKLLVKIDKGNNIPRHKRYKVTVDGCSCCDSCKPTGHVAIKGTRQFRDIYDDNDIVEIGSRRIIQHLARMVVKEDSDDEKEQSIANLNRSRALDEMMGLVERYRAQEDQDRPSRYNRRRDYHTRTWRR